MSRQCSFWNSTITKMCLAWPDWLPSQLQKAFWRGFYCEFDRNKYLQRPQWHPSEGADLTLQNQYPIPQRVSCQTDAFYLICDGMQSKLRIHLFEGTLKFFFDHPEDYYYLPAEDMAIHKSVATYVDKDFRKKATANNCYTKKTLSLFHNTKTLITPFFKESSKDKLTYFELTREFLDSDSLLRQYTVMFSAIFLPQNI